MKSFGGRCTLIAPGMVDTAFFYNPGDRLKRGTYFATIKQSDGANDKGSNLSRDGVWRVNIGVHRETFLGLFGPPTRRPAEGRLIEGPWNLTTLGTLTPHPVYGWMGGLGRNLKPGRRELEQLQSADRRYGRACSWCLTSVFRISGWWQENAQHIITTACGSLAGSLLSGARAR
jgi:hypothetical protein